ncbi:MAG: lysophospholipid acyltransferase family protein [Vampirovibrionales bacterium]|nr:lysophospholipid acyltransferase family protein [Vampirovibrionales bacterium]
MWFSAKHPHNKILPEQLHWFAQLIQYLSLSICYCLYKFQFDRIVIAGREKIPPKGTNYIAASNHTSDLDPPVMSVALRFRPISYMAKQELFDASFLGSLYYRSIGSFSVNREKLELATIKSSLTVLKHPGWILGIFPEGTRNREGKVGEAKRGVAYIAKTAKVGILPMAVMRIPARSGKASQGKVKEDLCVQIGDFMPYDETLSVEALMAIIQERLETLAEEAKTL